MNLGQTSGNYPIHLQTLRRLAKNKIPDHLGFSGHMKPGLSNDNGDSNENIKKAIVKQQLCT